MNTLLRAHVIPSRELFGFRIFISCTLCDYILLHSAAAANVLSFAISNRDSRDFSRPSVKLPAEEYFNFDFAGWTS
jgi:hypothetical protein